MTRADALAREFIYTYLKLISGGSNMAKSLCKWKKKDIEKNVHELIQIVDKPRYLCKDCARVAHDKGFLCKPINLH